MSDLVSNGKHISEVLEQMRFTHRKDKLIQNSITELNSANSELEDQIMELHYKNKSIPKVSDKIILGDSDTECTCRIRKGYSKYFKFSSKQKYGPFRVRI